MGYVFALEHMFTPPPPVFRKSVHKLTPTASGSIGLPLVARGDVAGPVGGTEDLGRLNAIPQPRRWANYESYFVQTEGLNDTDCIKRLGGP